MSTWDVTRRRPDTLEVPDSLASIWEVVSEESSTVLTIENSSEAPFITRKRAEVKNLDNEQISWHRRFAFGVVHANWPTQVMNLVIRNEILVFEVPCNLKLSNNFRNFLLRFERVLWRWSIVKSLLGD